VATAASALAVEADSEKSVPKKTAKPGILGLTKSETVGKIQIFKRTIATGVSGQPDLSILLRLPKGHTAESPTAKGVLAFCTWQNEESTLKNHLIDSSNNLGKFADENGLALMTWNTETLWKSGHSHEDLDRFEKQALRRDFDSLARAWNRGVSALCKEFALPETGMLLYGISRGAHYAQRLALRLPDRFLAVHIHVGNSYDKLTTKSGKTIWLITSGDLDRGKHDALSFYHEGRERKMPMILKIVNGLGHSSNSQIERLRDSFFKYALEQEKLAPEQGKTAADIVSSALENPPYFGDVLSQQVFPARTASFLPSSQRISLPTEEFANIWASP
jgi:hypothetical protein